jgi:hypothetical protein
MALLLVAEEPSRKSSVFELAALLEEAPSPMTLGDAFMQLGVVDPGAAAHLIGNFSPRSRTWWAICASYRHQAPPINNRAWSHERCIP